MIKVGEVFEGKYRAEQVEELVGTLENIIKEAEGIAAYDIKSRSRSHDPMDADILLQIDFESEDALKEYDLDLDRVALYMKIAEHAIGMLTYEHEL